MPNAPAETRSRNTPTRAALIRAGLRLFAERPIDAVPIDDIVSAAGVAKGSFFNHFEDKQNFANAVATEVRLDIETRVASANAALRDPLERLVGGMVVGVDFALTQPERATIMLRGLTLATGRNHPLNQGVREDIDACIAEGIFNEATRRSAMLFWFGACQTFMLHVIDRKLPRAEAAERMQEIISMALTGLGVVQDKRDRISRVCAAQLASGEIARP